MRKEELLVVLVGTYIAAILISNATAGRLVEVGGWVFPGAIFLFSLTFTLRDAIQVAGGLRVAQTLIWAGLLANALLAGYGLLINALPRPEWFNAEPYTAVFSTTARVVVASLAAYGVSTYLDTLVFHRFRQNLLGRVLASNVSGVLVDTAVFIILAFAGTGAPLLNLIFGQVGIKLVVSTVIIPVVYWVRGTLRRQGLAVEGY